MRPGAYKVIIAGTKPDLPKPIDIIDSFGEFYTVTPRVSPDIIWFRITSLLGGLYPGLFEHQLDTYTRVAKVYIRAPGVILYRGIRVDSSILHFLLIIFTTHSFILRSPDILPIGIRFGRPLLNLNNKVLSLKTSEV